MNKLELKNEIYSVENIKETIGVYQGFAKIKMTQYKDKTILEFKKCKLDETLTIKEFENYLIGLENS